MNVNQQETLGDKFMALVINVLARVIEVWVALVILNWLGLIPT
jgi:hypothetical protein